MMKAEILGLLAETPIHPGSRRGLGVVDLPVAREAATDYPVIVGSSLKGALKDKAEQSESVHKAAVSRAFGEQDHAGALLVSDARLLLLPVRSLTSSYRWATCPHILERLHRDLGRAGRSPDFEVPEVGEREVLTSGSGTMFLEERQFEIIGDPPQALIDEIAGLVAHEDTRNRLGNQIAVLNDGDFAWFARYGLSIQARNVLDDAKRSKNLWYEETLPPDTVMYAVIAGRSHADLNVLTQLFPENDPYLQAGGNETVGQGWFAVTRPGRGRRDGQ